MDRTEHNIEGCPTAIVERLQEMGADATLRRRVILSRDGKGEWSVLLVVVDATASPSDDVDPSVGFNALRLVEDWWTPSETIEMLAHLDGGTLTIRDQSFPVATGYWSVERQSSRGSYFGLPGLRAERRVSENKDFPHDILLAADKSVYFPSVEAALRTWAPFTIFHGRSDGRLGEFHIFLPEERGQFLDVHHSGDAINGSISHTRLEDPIVVLGAFEIDGRTVNETASIQDGSFELPTPPDCTSWELILCTDKSEPLDRWMSRDSAIRRRSNSGDEIETVVRMALDYGEGPQVELKPFLTLPLNNPRTEPESGAKKKFKEICQSLAAMANTEGGHVILGITDDLRLDDDRVGLAASLKSEITSEGLERYRGFLFSKLNDRLVTKCKLTSLAGFFEEFPLIVFSITANPSTTPTHLFDDPALYVRRGANNTKLPPSEWGSYMQRFAPQTNKYL